MKLSYSEFFQEYILHFTTFLWYAAEIIWWIEPKDNVYISIHVFLCMGQNHGYGRKNRKDVRSFSVFDLFLGFKSFDLKMVMTAPQ